MRRDAIPRLFLISLACILSGNEQLANAQGTLALELQQKIDKIASDVLAKTEVPSASIAIVKAGQIEYIQAYGSARFEPSTPATSQMRYSIGSISKQFTVAALLLLQEHGKLSLDDKVAKFIPRLTQAEDVSIRQLLSHTAGYQDYWPQDYVLPAMLQPVTAQKIADGWARKPLDFESGTKWQYSNTNYVIAGLIVEKASGMPLMQFLRENVFAPLGMNSVVNIDDGKLGDTDAAGYMRYALGPLRPAPKEARGWLFAAGELALTAEDMAKWDISIVDQKLLKPPSYRAFETEVLLKNGMGTGYGLGVFVSPQFGHRALSHGGEVSGFTAENMVFPDERAAIVVLTNQDASEAPMNIARGIAPLLLAADDPGTEERVTQARRIFENLQHGTIDRSIFTENANFYFNEQALNDFRSGLGTLGPPEEFVQVRQALRGGMKLRVYSIKFAKMSLQAWTYEMPDGKLEQYQIAPEY